MGLKLIQPFWDSNLAEENTLIQAMYMNGKVDFSNEDAKSGLNCPKYHQLDWSTLGNVNNYGFQFV